MRLPPDRPGDQKNNDRRELTTKCSLCVWWIRLSYSVHSPCYPILYGCFISLVAPPAPTRYRRPSAGAPVFDLTPMIQLESNAHNIWREIRLSIVLLLYNVLSSPGETIFFNFRALDYPISQSAGTYRRERQKIDKSILYIIMNSWSLPGSIWSIYE